MKVGLQAWYDVWRKTYEDTDLIYVSKNKDGPYSKQVHFVRDTLGLLFWKDIPYEKRPNEEAPRDDCKVSAYVIGEHTSKSVGLPVYSLERPDLGLQVVLRNNFYDWNVSVVSEKPIAAEILEGHKLGFSSEEEQEKFRPGNYWGYLFFQGFPEELRFGPHSLNQCKFSIAIGGDYSLYTFLWLILREIRRSKKAGKETKEAKKSTGLDRPIEDFLKDPFED